MRVWCAAEPAERGPDRMPAGAGKQLAQSQNTATADPQGDQGKSDGILGSLRVCPHALVFAVCQKTSSVAAPSPGQNAGVGQTVPACKCVSDLAVHSGIKVEGLGVG